MQMDNNNPDTNGATNPGSNQCLVALGRLQVTSVLNTSDLSPHRQNEFVSRHSEDLKMTFCDQRVSAVLGYSASDLLDKSLLDFVHIEEHMTCQDAFEQAWKLKGQVITVMIRLRNVNGEYTPIGCSMFAFVNPYSDEVEYVVLTNTSTKGLQHRATSMYANHSMSNVNGTYSNYQQQHSFHQNVVAPTPPTGFCATAPLTYTGDAPHPTPIANKSDNATLADMSSSRPSAICYLPANDHLYEPPALPSAYNATYYDTTATPTSSFHPSNMHPSLYNPSLSSSSSSRIPPLHQHRTDSSSAPSQSSIDTSSSCSTDIFNSHHTHMQPLIHSAAAASSSRLFTPSSQHHLTPSLANSPPTNIIHDNHHFSMHHPSIVYNSLYHHPNAHQRYDEMAAIAAASNGLAHI